MVPVVVDSLSIIALIVRECFVFGSLFCNVVLSVLSSLAIISLRKREPAALLLIRKFMRGFYFSRNLAYV